METTTKAFKARCNHPCTEGCVGICYCGPCVYCQLDDALRDQHKFEKLLEFCREENTNLREKNIKMDSSSNEATARLELVKRWVEAERAKRDNYNRNQIGRGGQIVGDSHSPRLPLSALIELEKLLGLR